jgi:hypothetical protein|tara:strand:+ start:3100 stop:3369 length:270 start_codon:yes stop_codon:yes gene_type:complete
MIDIFSIIDDLRFRTSLLESLEWDEDLLQTFLFYFDDALKSDTDPQSLLSDIQKYFGRGTHDIIVKLFKEEALNVDGYLDNIDGENDDY